MSKKLPNLADLLALEGINQPQLQIAYCKLLAYSGCFDEPDLFKNFGTKKHAALAVAAKQAADLWKNTHLSQKNKKYQYTILSDLESKSLLKIEFPSLEQGFFWLSTVKDVHMLPNEFFEEGVAQDIEKTAVNTRRWEENPEKKINISQVHDENSLYFKLYQCAKTLQLTDAFTWPKTTVKHVVLLSSIEKFIVERIRFIAESAVDPIEYFYVLVGPRGLFNFEKTLPAILAQWFGKPDEEHKIRTVIDQLPKNTPLSWTQDLAGLKRIILKALRVDEWPNNLDSYYYKDKEVYDDAALKSGRQLLDCEGGPWPVTLDLVHYHLNDTTLSLKLKNPNMKIMPVVSQGKEGRLVRVDDLVDHWYYRYGKQLLMKGEKPLFIACNATHTTIPFIIQNFLHTQYYQDAITFQNIRKKLDYYSDHAFKEIDLELPAMSNPISIAGPGAENLQLDWVFSALAKMSFSKRSHIKMLIKEKQIDDEQESNQISSMRKMILYNASYPVKLINSAIDLAQPYHNLHDFIKVAGLFNFSMNVLRKINQQESLDLLNDFKKSIVVNLSLFISYANQRLNRARSQSSNNTSDLAIVYEKNLSQLSLVRNRLLNKFRKTKPMDIDDIKDLYELCFQLMTQFFISLIEQSYELTGKPNENWAFISFGSYSRKQATPYSDIEFGIVTESDDITHPKEITKFILLMIINLGETVLSSLGISAYNRNGNKISFYGSLFDRYTPNGYSFDQACKTPLGKKVDGLVKYRLIGTASTLSNLCSSLESYNEDPYLPQILMLPGFIYGDRDLYLKYIKYLSDKNMPHSYGLSLLEKDLEKYLPELTESITQMTHNKYFHRPLSILIDILYCCYNPSKNCDSFHKIDTLLSNEAFDVLQRNSYQDILLKYMFLRFKYHFKYNEQKLEIFNQEPEFQEVKYVRNKLITLYCFFQNKINEYNGAQIRKEAHLNNAVLFQYRSLNTQRQNQAIACFANKQDFFIKIKNQ